MAIRHAQQGQAERTLLGEQRSDFAAVGSEIEIDGSVLAILVDGRDRPGPRGVEAVHARLFNHASHRDRGSVDDEHLSIGRPRRPREALLGRPRRLTLRVRRREGARRRVRHPAGFAARERARLTSVRVGEIDLMIDADEGDLAGNARTERRRAQRSEPDGDDSEP